MEYFNQELYGFYLTALFHSSMSPCVNMVTLGASLFPVCFSSGHGSCSNPHQSTLHGFDPMATPGRILCFLFYTQVRTKSSNDKGCILISPGLLTARGLLVDVTPACIRKNVCFSYYLNKQVNSIVISRLQN